MAAFLLATVGQGSPAWAAEERGSGLPLVGAYADLASLPAKARIAELTRLAANGASAVRLPLDWNRVEPRPKQFNWKTDDAIVNAARARNLEVVLVLGPCAVWAVNPAWRVPAKERSCSLPKSIALWERYVRQAVTHFRGRVRYWQVREQPNARNFRGARSEYLRLLASAARVARQADPKAVIVVPEAGSLDIAEVDRLCGSEARGSCGVFGLYLPSSADLSAPSLAWAALHEQVLVTASARRPVWVLGAESRLPAEVWMQQYLLSAAFEVERFHLPADVIAGSWLGPLAQLRYLGFLQLGPEVWALVFQDGSGPVVAAWSGQQRQVPISDLAPVHDPGAAGQSSLLGGGPGSAMMAEGEDITLCLGPRPALIRGLDVTPVMHAGNPTRADVLAARPGADLSGLPSVSADYSRAEQAEVGLYNRPLRERVHGHVKEEVRNGRRCLRAQVYPGPGESELDNPWIYFDVDDHWLYLARGKAPVAITVECEGAYLGEKTLGFNIMYDSTRGYRFTPWQWVAPGPGWQHYRVELDDVSFANRNGYDFRINIKGSKQDMWVASVTVEKLPTPGKRSP